MIVVGEKHGDVENDGLEADHGQPDEQEPDIFHGRAPAFIYGPVRAIVPGSLDLIFNDVRRPHRCDIEEYDDCDK